MSKYYADYAYEWKTEHPIQTFLMGIEISKDWKSFGTDSDYYYNKPEEAGMLALTPFKSGSHIFGFVAYVFILIMLFCSIYYMQFSFDTMMYLCGAFTLCHCVYMYYFTSLPRMKDENLRKKHTLSELFKDGQLLRFRRACTFMRSKYVICRNQRYSPVRIIRCGFGKDFKRRVII